MHELIGLDQDEESLDRRGLDLSQFAPKILDKDLLQASAELNRLLADELEAPACGFSPDSTCAVAKR